MPCQLIATTTTNTHTATEETTRVPVLLCCCGSLRMVIKPHLIIRIMDDLKITAECQRQLQRRGGSWGKAGKTNNVQHGTRHTFNFLKTHKTWLSWLNCKSKTCFKDYFCATHTHSREHTRKPTHTVRNLIKPHTDCVQTQSGTVGGRSVYICTYVSDICIYALWV